MEINKNVLYRAIQKICYASSYDKKNDVIYCRLFEEQTIFDFKNDKTYHYMTGRKQWWAIETCINQIKSWYRGCSYDRTDDLSKTMKKYIASV